MVFFRFLSLFCGFLYRFRFSIYVICVMELTKGTIIYPWLNPNKQQCHNTCHEQGQMTLKNVLICSQILKVQFCSWSEVIWSFFYSVVQYPAVYHWPCCSVLGKCAFFIATCNKPQFPCHLFGNVLPWLVMSFCSAEVLPQGLSLAAILRPSQILAWQVCVCILACKPWQYSMWINAVAEVIHPSCLLCPRNTEWEKDSIPWKKEKEVDSKYTSLSKSMFTDYIKTSSNVSELEISFSQSQHGR